MSYKCPTCKMQFNKREHAKCGRCPAPEPQVLTLPTGEFWPHATSDQKSGDHPTYGETSND